MRDTLRPRGRWCRRAGGGGHGGGAAAPAARGRAGRRRRPAGGRHGRAAARARAAHGPRPPGRRHAAGAACPGLSRGYRRVSGPGTAAWLCPAPGDGQHQAGLLGCLEQGHRKCGHGSAGRYLRRCCPCVQAQCAAAAAPLQQTTARRRTGLGSLSYALSRYECAAARHAATLTARLQLRLRAVVPCRVAAAAAQCAWLYGRQRRTFFVTMRMTESGQVLRRAVVCCRAAARRACAAHAVCWGPCSACGCSHLWPGLGAVGARIKARGSHPGGACDAPWSTGSCRRIQGRLGSASCSGAAADARAARAGVHDGAGIPAVHRVLAGGRGRLPRARLGLYPRGAGGARPAMQHALFSSRV